jgi:glyceraldehyde 3-phosphate dehydrogenase
MSTVKVAINGFGRIGRLVYRQIFNMDGIDIVAINDLTSPKVLAHLLKYDTAQGRFEQDVKATDNSIIVNGHEVKIYAQKDPAQIPWGAHDVDVVLECTGFFTDKDKAAAHLTAGAKKVVISAPATGDLKTVSIPTITSLMAQKPSSAVLPALPTALPPWPRYWKINSAL